MNQIITVILSTILLLFANLPRLIAEVKNPDPARFNQPFKEFSKQDQVKEPNQNQLILFTGSSSIRFWDIEKSFPQKNLLNRGFGGAHISDVLYFYDHLFPKYRPVRIIFYCGENDLWSGKPVDQVKVDFSARWLKIKKDLPKSDLVYLSCKPSPKRISKWNLYQSLNLKIKKLSHFEERLHFVDISKTLLKSDMTFHKGLWRPDNLHLNAAGYTKWSRVVSPWLNIITRP